MSYTARELLRDFFKVGKKIKCILSSSTLESLTVSRMLAFGCLLAFDFASTVLLAETMESDTVSESATETEDQMSQRIYNETLRNGIDQEYFKSRSTDLSTPGCSFAAPPDRIPDKMIALTFDDGPSPALSETLLDILGRNDVKATFFLIGKKVAGNESILRAYSEGGHFVANHSFSHPDFHKISLNRAQQEVQKTQKLLGPYLSSPLKYFRYPYGNSTCAMDSFLNTHKLYSVGWHVDSCDWAFADGEVEEAENITCRATSENKSSANLLAHAIEKTEAAGGGIVLFHEIHRKSIETIDDYIKEMKSRGFSFVTLNDRRAFPKLNGDK